MPVQAAKTPGKRSLAMEAFATALRAIPGTICENAGKHGPGLPHSAPVVCKGCQLSAESHLPLGCSRSCWQDAAGFWQLLTNRSGMQAWMQQRSCRSFGPGMQGTRRRG